MNNYPLALREGHTAHKKLGQHIKYFFQIQINFCFQSSAVCRESIFLQKVCSQFDMMHLGSCQRNIVSLGKQYFTQSWHQRPPDWLFSGVVVCLSLAAHYSVPPPLQEWPGREHSAPQRPFFIQKLTQRRPDTPHFTAGGGLASVSCKALLCLYVT